MKKFNYNYIQVLWVEDDPDVIFPYTANAAKYGLQLVSFPCWDDARKALMDEFDRWSAIILDAKCKYHRDSEDNPVRFLGEALKDISVICKDRVIPWYILTGGAETEVSDSINDDRLKWDADWKEKKFYSKNTDTDILYRRIRVHANKSQRLQIHEKYGDICERLLELNIDVYDDIITILETMHFPDSHPDFNPRHFFNPLRKALEYVFRATQKVDIIPEDFFKSGIVNINQCFMFVIGKEAEKFGYKHRDGGITPRHIQDMMSLIINLGNANSHSFECSHGTELSEKEILDYDNQIKSVGGNSKFLVFSMALQFCEILQWMNNYITANSDKEENRKKWMSTKETVQNPESPDDSVGIVEFNNGKYHIGSKYLLNGNLIEQRGWLGKKVRIMGKDSNKSASSNIYPFFAYKIEPIE